MLSAPVAVWFATVAPVSAAQCDEIAIYSEIWADDPDTDGNIPIYGRAVAEGGAPCSTTLYSRLKNPSNSEIAANVGSGTGYVEVNVSTTLNHGSAPDGNYSNIAEAWSQGVHYGCSSSNQNFGKTDSRWKYNRQLPAGDYEYIRATANCNHKCENERQCHSQQTNWLGMKGWLVGSICFGHVIPHVNEPPCSGPFGSPLLGITGCSS